MASWSDDSVHRSLRRYLALLLGDPWELRLEQRGIADEDRPVAVVEMGPRANIRARTSLEQGEVVNGWPVTITCYPAVAPDERTGRQAAAELRYWLSQWLTVGLEVLAATPDGKPFAGPWRVPLWDYDEVPLTGPDKAGPADPHDVIWIEEGSDSVTALVDPEDPLRWTVVCEFRCSVEAPGRIKERTIFTDISGTFVPATPD